MSPLALLAVMGRQARTAPHPTPLEAERKLTPRLKALLLRDAARRDGWSHSSGRPVLCVDCGGLHDLRDQACPGCAASTDVSVLIRRVRSGEVICIDCLRTRPERLHACSFCGSDQWAGPVRGRLAS